MAVINVINFFFYRLTALDITYVHMQEKTKKKKLLRDQVGCF